MGEDERTTRGLIAALIDDGRPLIKLTGLALIGSGLFAFFLAATGHFLPHDVAHLRMAADELNAIADGRLAHFMMHDRVAFGGAILGVGTLYLWLAEFPLRDGKAWAWWTLMLSGVVGFASFLAYLGYGYLDTWHGVATLVLLPVFIVGMIKSRALLPAGASFRTLFVDAARPSVRSPFDVGRTLLAFTAVCLIVGGLIIMTFGMTTVFVPQDLSYMDVTAAELEEVNARLVPLIAHDRAGFGGGVCCCGVTMLFCVLCGAPSRSLWQALAITGVAGFGSAIGVHYPIGYTSFTHLAPAYLGAIMFITAMTLTWRRMMRGEVDGRR